MSNDMRDRLIELLNGKSIDTIIDVEYVTDHLIANGVTFQKHGAWKLNDDGSGTCSECGRTQRGVWDYDSYQQFCGCCGAKMNIKEK